MILLAETSCCLDSLDEAALRQACEPAEELFMPNLLTRVVTDAVHIHHAIGRFQALEPFHWAEPRLDSPVQTLMGVDGEPVTCPLAPYPLPADAGADMDCVWKIEGERLQISF